MTAQYDKEKMTGILEPVFQAFLENTSDMVFVKNTDLVYIAASVPFVKMAGKKSADEILGKSDCEIFGEGELAERYADDDKKLISEGRDRLGYLEPLADCCGKAKYGLTSKYLIRDGKGDVVGVFGVSKDVTLDCVAQRHYQHELTYLFELPANAYSAVFVDVDEWRVFSCRGKLINGCTVQPCHTVEGLVGCALKSIPDSGCDAARLYGNFTADALYTVYDDGKDMLSFEYERCMANGEMRLIDEEVRFFTDPENDHLCVMIMERDAEARRRADAELAESAALDRTTMLLNREATMENIRKALECDADSNHALFMIDVDNFTSFTDTIGQQAGDRFLNALAAQVRKCFRNYDIVGRIGDDEFFALMRSIPNSTVVRDKTRSMLAAIQEVCGEYSEYELSVSIGISLYPSAGSTLDELYAAADSALYQAKRKGRNQFVFA